jgi:hypothetical protein
MSVHVLHHAPPPLHDAASENVPMSTQHMSPGAVAVVSEQLVPPELLACISLNVCEHSEPVYTAIRTPLPNTQSLEAQAAVCIEPRWVRVVVGCIDFSDAGGEGAAGLITCPVPALSARMPSPVRPSRCPANLYLALLGYSGRFRGCVGVEETGDRALMRRWDHPQGYPSAQPRTGSKGRKLWGGG